MDFVKNQWIGIGNVNPQSFTNESRQDVDGEGQCPGEHPARLRGTNQAEVSRFNMTFCIQVQPRDGSFNLIPVKLQHSLSPPSVPGWHGAKSIHQEISHLCHVIIAVPGSFTPN